MLLGLAGVVLILHDRPMGGEAGWGWLASAVSLVSITLGTLYQRRYCSAIDWRSGNLVQFAGADTAAGGSAPRCSVGSSVMAGSRHHAGALRGRGPCLVDGASIDGRANGNPEKANPRL